MIFSLFSPFDPGVTNAAHNDAKVSSMTVEEDVNVNALRTKPSSNTTSLLTIRAFAKASLISPASSTANTTPYSSEFRIVQAGYPIFSKESMVCA